MKLRDRIATWLMTKGQAQEIAAMFTMRGAGAPDYNTTQIIQSYKDNPWLHAVVAKIAQHVAATEWTLYTKSGSNGKAVRSYSAQYAGHKTRGKLIREMRVKKELKEIEKHPLLAMLNTANPLMTSNAAMKVTQEYLSLKGEAFWTLERNGMGAPIEYYPVHPAKVMETPKQGQSYYKIQTPTRIEKVETQDVIWFRELDPDNPYGRGAGRGQSLGDEIDIEGYIAKTLKTWFINGAQPDLMVQVEGADQDALDNVRARFEQAHRGNHNANRSFWTSGGIKVEKLNSSFTDMQLVELRRQERDNFVHVYGIPPEILGIIENANRATVHEARSIFAEEVLVPALELLRTTLQSYLVPQFDNRLILDYVSPSPEDEELELQAMQAAPWAATVGEWRERMGLEHRGDVDNVHMIPMNLYPVKAGEAPPLPAATPPPQPKQLTAPEINDAVWNTPTQIRLGTSFEEVEPTPIKKGDPGGIAEGIADACQANRLEKELAPYFEDEVEQFANEAIEAVGSNIAFNMLNPVVVDYFKDFGANRVSWVNEETKKQIRKAIDDGIRDGDGAAQIQNRIKGVMDLRYKNQGIRIARTEVTRASNFATHQGWKQSGVIAQKQWAATFINTREEHAELTTYEPIPIDAEWNYNGNLAKYPGDFGVAELDINCQCYMSPVIDRPKSVEELEAVHKAYIDRVQPWEAGTMKRLRKAFNQQTKDMIKAVDAIMG